MFRLLRYMLLTGILSLWITTGCAAPKGVYHTVQRGQTLYRIGRVYQVDVNRLARLNRLNNRSQLKVGQRLFIPGASRVKYVPATVPASSSGTRKSVASSASSGRVTKPVPPKSNSASAASSAKPAPAKPSRPAAVSKQASAAVKGTFVWPARGSLLKKFGQNGSQTSKGIEIATRSGSAVVAAAAGKVTYSGDGIQGFGNLVILKHDHSYFTVYGFNQANLVTTGSFVSQGQKIALAGRPPGGGQSRLHFEIRRGKEAVNPINLLP